MSKHWMDKLWSWDHCFNAMALAPGRTDAAIDQFLAPFDHQDECGALPDSVTHSEILYNYVKPPIHGWALQRVRATATRELTVEELGRIHDCLARWSRFWLDSRRRAGHVLPYYQHGNDSGWDNSTTFDVDRVVESPDLAGFLALQLDVLADLSDELELPAGEWAPPPPCWATGEAARVPRRSVPCRDAGPGRGAFSPFGRGRSASDSP